MHVCVFAFSALLQTLKKKKKNLGGGGGGGTDF